MSLDFDPRYFLGLGQKKAYTIKSILAMEGTPPTMNALSQAEEAIKNFIHSPPESSLKELKKLHKSLFDYKYEKNKKNMPPFFTDSALLDAAQIFNQYTENQAAITKAIHLFMESYNNPHRTLSPESLKMVEDIVEILLERNEKLMQSIPDFSPENLQKAKKTLENMTLEETSPNFKNWSKVKDKFLEKIHSNSKYYKELCALSFEQDKREALRKLDTLKAVKSNKPNS